MNRIVPAESCFGPYQERENLMSLLYPRSVSFLAFLFLAACATTKVAPPALPDMPRAPEVVLDAPPAPPPFAPRPPVPPTYTLPKATDIAWQTVWQEDLVNDCSPGFASGGQLSPAALVVPKETPESARIGMVSGLMAINIDVADMGKDSGAGLALKDSAPAVAWELQLLDPIGRWTFSEAFKVPAVKSVFVVRVYEHRDVTRGVVKFDIEPHLQPLEEYNEKVVLFQSRREAHLADRAKYDQQYANYSRAMQAWRAEMIARIEAARRQHEENSRRAEAEYTQRWETYRRQAKEQGSAPAQKVELERKPFPAPELPEPRPPEPENVPDALAPLSLSQMRDLLLDRATEVVPATRVRLGGQIVDARTGFTIATVDAALVLPTGAGRTEAGMLRELMQRLAR